MKKITFFLILLGVAYVLNAQDSCLTATAISAGSFNITTINGTETPSPICAENGTGSSGGEWYIFTATVDGVAHVTTDLPANAGGDTRMHVYTGTCGSLICVGGNDDIDISGGNYLSDFTWIVSNGATYYIAFDDRWSASGFDFELTESSVSCPSGIPLTEDFDSSNQFAACYTVEDTDGNGVSWMHQFLDLDGDLTDEDFATNGINSNKQKNDWLFSSPITLVSGTDYHISFKFNGADAANPNKADEDLEIVIIDAASSSGTVLTTLYSQTGIVQTGLFEELETLATTQMVNYTSTVSGTYYLAFHMTSPRNSGFLLLFDYSIDQTLGVGDFETNSFKHFYNCDSDILTLKSSNLSFDNIELYNIIGQQVLSNKLSQTDETINLSLLKDGIYFVKVNIDSNTQTIKLLKN